MKPLFAKDLGGFILRSPTENDAEVYARNFSPLDPEASYLTGSRTDFTRDEVVAFFLKCLTAPDRCDLLMVSHDGRIIGESIINEIRNDSMTANFRICIFRPEDRNRGFGSLALLETLRIAFEELCLASLSLTVYSFNPRAIHLYEKAGFRETAVFEAEEIETSAKEYEMTLTRSEWVENII